MRKRSKLQALPDEDTISDTEDAESDIAERLDDSHYRDDILRLLFICCHPDLPATQQIALALRIVSGLSVTQIARAFLVSESAMMSGVPLSAADAGFIASANFVGYLVGAVLAAYGWAAGRERLVALSALLATAILLAAMGTATICSRFPSDRIAAKLRSQLVFFPASR